MVSMLNKVPHWLFVVVMTFAGGFEGYLQQNTSGILTALGDKTALEHMVIGAAFAGATSLLALAKKSWLPDAAKLLPLALVLGLGVATSGCLSIAPIVPVTPANQAQVASCSTTASVHNGFVLGDIVIGGVTTGLAGVSAAVTDNSTKTALAISAAVAAGLTAIGTGGVGLTTANFEDSKCSDVVGSLPLASKAAQ